MVNKGIGTGPLGVSRIFVSAEINADGNEQDTPHGLGDTPTLVFVTITDNNGGADAVVAEGVHDATDVKINVTATAKYKVIAFA